MSTGNLEIDAKWGPFSPVYLGVSHILDSEQGAMADMPLFVGRHDPATVILPENTFDYFQNVDTGERSTIVRAMPENVAADYSSYSLRYFIDRQGDTARAKFYLENSRQIRCDIEFNNSSDEERQYFYGLGLTVNDNRKKVLLKEALRPWWLPARNYNSIEAYQKVFGIGCRQCLTRVFNWGVEDQVLAQAFGGWMGDEVTYKMKLPKALKDGYIYFRYIKYGTVEQNWEVLINGKSASFSFPQSWAIPGGGGWGKNRDEYHEWKLLRIPVGEAATDIIVELRPIDAPENDTARIWLDGMLFSEGLIEGDSGKSCLLDTKLIDEPLAKSSCVRLEEYDDHSARFGIISNEQIRHALFETDGISLKAQSGEGSFIGSLRSLFKAAEAKVERDANIPSWVMVNSSLITVAPNSKKTVSFSIIFEDETAACTTPNRFNKPNTDLPDNPYSEMISRLKDLLIYNVNYPFNAADSNSLYYVPAKFFPLPYSWDGGFAALGMSSFASDTALKQTRYFFADEDLDYPLLYCGSPVPTQFYALWGVYEATRELPVLAKSYSGAKRMYDFYLGRTPGSVVNEGNDGLLSTYAYCYNLGIDDHPIQRWAEHNNVTRKGLYSIILMAQVLRVAKIMRNIAFLLDKNTDIEQYSRDIDLLSGIIDGKMWDKESRLYGWLYRNGDKVEPLVLDGCAGDQSSCTFFPLFAGLCGHKRELFEHLLSPDRFLTPFGISSVDMSAPYYDPNGYWNGGIWPVMQWYVWRGLLEAGEIEIARDVADRILSTWNQGFKEKHYLGEHFRIESESMSGVPNFGGLSAVLIPMYEAYFGKYQVTTPYDVIILNKSVDKESDTVLVSLSAPFMAAGKYSFLINMGQRNKEYQIIINDQLHGKYVSDESGHISILLPPPSYKDSIFIQPDNI